MKGQSHALWLAREHLHGPLLLCFADTLIQTDFSFLAAEPADVVAWVMPVADPRRFGVAEVAKDGWVRRFIEKPSSMDNNLVVVGCYFFRSAESLLEAIEAQIERGRALRNEYFLADAISIMIERGARVRTQQVSSWLDTGTIEATLDTNKLLLERLHLPAVERATVKTIAPVAIHPTAEISDSIIGPYASIGPNCQITNSHITESILEADSQIKDVALTRSLVGSRASVLGRGDGQVVSLNVGDDSQVEFLRAP
jgi:glucose-1-phosphate thymidylyltransferase